MINLEKHKINCSWRCTCTPGYFGVNCDQQYNPCLSNPCFNDGICIGITPLQYICND